MAKFSFDLPRLIASTKTDRSKQPVHLDSPPPTPKSVRPPLPEDVEAALRSVCAQIFNESNGTCTTIPTVEQDIIKSFWANANVEHNARPQASQVIQRLDSLMTKTKDEPPPRPVHTASPSHLTATIPRKVKSRRPAGHPRAESVDTTNSASQSDSTEPLSASTGITSAALTPARGSKRVSVHAQTPSIDAYCKPDMTKTSLRHAGDEINSQLPIESLFKTSMREEATKDARHQGRSQTNNHKLARPIAAPADSEEVSHQQAAISNIVNSSQERQGRSTLRSRATSSARSLSRGVQEYFKPGSSHTDESTRQATLSFKDILRSASAIPRKPSLDFFRHRRRVSNDSLDPRALYKLPQDTTQAFYKSSKPMDLNRELPPLPALDSYTGDAEADGLPYETRESWPSKSVERDMKTTTLQSNATRHADSPISPWPEMSATAFPGDYDLYGPLRTPSPISESSLRELGAQSPGASFHSFDTEVEDEVSLETPKVATVLSRLSVHDLRPHIVQNRRPSNPTRASQEEVAIQDIPEPPCSLPTTKTAKKQWWKAVKLKRQDWMSDVERTGSHSGMPVLSDIAASPVIRYS